MNCFPPSIKLKTAALEMQAVNSVWKKRWGHLGKWDYTRNRTNPEEAAQ